MPSRLRGDRAMVRLRIMSSRRAFISGSRAAFAHAKTAPKRLRACANSNQPSCQPADGDGDD
jgi:hypothetical protein